MSCIFPFSNRIEPAMQRIFSSIVDSPGAGLDRTAARSAASRSEPPGMCPGIAVKGGGGGNGDGSGDGSGGKDGANGDGNGNGDGASGNGQGGGCAEGDPICPITGRMFLKDEPFRLRRAAPAALHAVLQLEHLEPRRRARAGLVARVRVAGRRQCAEVYDGEARKQIFPALPIAGESVKNGLGWSGRRKERAHAPHPRWRGSPTALGPVWGNGITSSRSRTATGTPSRSSATRRARWSTFNGLRRAAGPVRDGQRGANPLCPHRHGALAQALDGARALHVRRRGRPGERDRRQRIHRELYLQPRPSSTARSRGSPTAIDTTAGRRTPAAWRAGRVHREDRRRARGPDSAATRGQGYAQDQGHPSRRALLWSRASATPRSRTRSAR